MHIFSLNSLLEKTSSLLRLIPDINASHIFKNNNLEVDQLSKETLHVPNGTCTILSSENGSEVEQHYAPLFYEIDCFLCLREGFGLLCAIIM